MLRVTTLYAGTAATTAAYYTAYLTKADGELPGQWMGRQAAAFGLRDMVTTEQLEALLCGRDPISGTQLGNVLVDRTTAIGTVVRAVAGFDATLSAPKSLSVWWALTGDERLAECHDVAVATVVKELERFGATTRIRHSGGRLHPDTQGLTVAAFRQSTSRADDPQLHTHLVISSKVQTDDGRWLALDARMLKGHQRAFGGLYQSVLRAELTHRFGVGFGEIVNGQAEIAGVPEALLDRFSKRTAQVDRAVVDKLAEFWKREGRDPTSIERAAMTREAAADTRRHKTGDGVPNLRTRWLHEAGELGVTAPSLTASIAAAARELEPRGRTTVQDIIERSLNRAFRMGLTEVKRNEHANKWVFDPRRELVQCRSIRFGSGRHAFMEHRRIMLYRGRPSPHVGTMVPGAHQRAVEGPWTLFADRSCDPRCLA
jgi:conjugative relaxase-like TrwC/TraI family protein